MKKLCMCTIIGSSGRDCVLIILFELYGPKVGLFEGNFLWVGQYNHNGTTPKTFILEELIQH